ncbi:MAG: tripartite tricarboxylate transporter TctB family protein [Dehalococcoidales bacterium]|nr:tripartite tricarboxylate transporter TctB family protein [Dehalococcoidales bacterium]
MRTGHLAVSAVSLAISLAYLMGALATPIGAPDKPGPGFFPVLVGGMLVALSMALFIQSWRMVPVGDAGEFLPAGIAGRRVLGVVIGLVGYTVLLTTLGYLVVGALVIILVLRVLGMHSWRNVILTAAVCTAVSYYLFSVALGVPLPQGVWMP